MIVVDASVLANAIGDDGLEGTRARQALRGHDLASPGLIDVEVLAVLRKRWLAGDLGEERFGAAVDDLLAVPVARYPMLALMLRAAELKANLSPYDASYVALAETLRCPLLTSDRRLARAPGPRCEVRVVDG
ncbi:MAG: type II toxin-antitoxin system VapC family toxin [Acidimicrobiales bacterium]|nr:type II toxin-antitoxin system VapC family toxin [Acidimicrobiales bacterium]